jgi:hypothetical protein
MVPLGDSHTGSCQTYATLTSRLMRLLTLLQVELLNTSLVRSDGGALDTDRVLLDSFGSIDSDLIVGLISIGETEIVVLEIDVEVRVDKLVLDVLPDDTGHLITVQLDDRVLNLDLVECSHPSSLLNCSKSGSRNELRSHGSVGGVLEKATGSSRAERGAHGRCYGKERNAKRYLGKREGAAREEGTPLRVFK